MHKRIVHPDETPGPEVRGEVDLPDAIERLKKELAEASPGTLSDTERLDLRELLDTLAKLIGNADDVGFRNEKNGHPA